MLRKIKTIFYTLLNLALFFVPSFSMAGVEDIQKNLNEKIRIEIMDALSSTALGWGGLGGQIFVICFAIAIFQAFKKFGPEMLMSLVSLGLKSWVVMALVGGPTYSNELSQNLFGMPGQGSLDLDLWNFVSKISDGYADKLSVIDGMSTSTALTVETAKINVFISRMFKSSKDCKSDSPTFAECVDSIIKTGEYKKNTTTTEEEGSSWISRVGGAILNVIGIITQVYVFLYTGIFPLVLMLVTLIRFGANMCIFIILGLTTAVSMMLAKIIVPFYLLKRFEGSVLSAVKVPMAAALYGFAQAIVILLGYAIMKGVNQAANEQFVSSMSSTSTGAVQMAGEMLNMFAALYITQLLIVIMQIMALLKIPSFCQDLLNLQLGNFVKFGEELFKAGVGLIGTVAQISATVASGGAAAVGMLTNFSGLGGFLGKVSGGVKGISSGLGKGISSKLSNSSLGKNISAVTSRAKDRFETTTGYSLSGPAGGVSVDSARTSRGGGGGDMSGAASGVASDSMFPKGGAKQYVDQSEKEPSILDKAKDMGKDLVRKGFAVGAGGSADLTQSFIETGLGGARIINQAIDMKSQSAAEKASDAMSLRSKMWVGNAFSATEGQRAESLNAVKQTLTEKQKTVLTDSQQSGLNDLLAKNSLSQEESNQVSSYLSDNILTDEQSASAKNLVSKTHMDVASRLKQGRSAYSSTEEYEQDMSYLLKNKNRDVLSNNAKTQTRSLEQSNKDFSNFVKEREIATQKQIENIQGQGFATQGSLLAAQSLMDQYNDGAVSREQLSKLSTSVEKEDLRQREMFEKSIQDNVAKSQLSTLTAQDMLNMKNSIEANKSYLVGNNKTINAINEIKKSTLGKLNDIDLSFDLNDYKADSSSIDMSKVSAAANASHIGTVDYSFNTKTGKIENSKTRINPQTGEVEIVMKNGRPLTEEATTVREEFLDSLNKEMAKIKQTQLLMQSNKEEYLSHDEEGEVIQSSMERYDQIVQMLKKREDLVSKALEEVAKIRSKKK